MKKNKIWALVILGGFSAFASTQLRAEVPPESHACVFVASTKSQGTLSCIGGGTACKVVGDCLAN